MEQAKGIVLVTTAGSTYMWRGPRDLLENQGWIHDGKRKLWLAEILEAKQAATKEAKYKTAAKMLKREGLTPAQKESLDHYLGQCRSVGEALTWATFKSEKIWDVQWELEGTVTIEDALAGRNMEFLDRGARKTQGRAGAARDLRPRAPWSDSMGGP